MIYAVLVIGILNLFYLIHIQLQVRQTAVDLGKACQILWTKIDGIEK